MFTQNYIKDIVKRDLDNDITIPSGHKGALVTVIDINGAHITLATKIKDNWDVQVIGKHDWTGENDIGVMSKVTW